MEKIIIYKCSDGFRTEDYDEAYTHENEITIKEIADNVAKVLHEEIANAFCKND